MLTIKANEELFEKYQVMSVRVRHLGAIAQNDMEVDEDDYAEHLEIAHDVLTDLEILLNETADYVAECQK